MRHLSKYKLFESSVDREDIEADIIHIFDDLIDDGFRVSVCMEDKNEYVYIDREDNTGFDGPTVVKEIERLKIFLKGTPFEPTDVYYTMKSLNGNKGIKNGIDRFIYNCGLACNSNMKKMKAVKIYLT